MNACIKYNKKLVQWHNMLTLNLSQIYKWVIYMNKYIKIIIRIEF